MTLPHNLPHYLNVFLNESFVLILPVQAKMPTIPTKTPRVFHWKRRGNGCFQVLSTWNTRGVFVGIARFPLFSMTINKSFDYT